MTEYCKHGVNMATTCRKCGRTMVVEVPDFAARKNGFTNSIDLLEETVRKMKVELAQAAAAPPPPSPEPVDEASPKEDPEPNAPPVPPERFPWQRG
ncbi:hypothetical protein BH23ACT12_BH23ACT12_01020 [soil metagenome]